MIIKKEYALMDLEELVKAYLEELDSFKDNFTKKYKWLRRLNSDTTSIDPIKVRTMRGYLLGCKDCGVNIGDLKLILEFISIKLEG